MNATIQVQGKPAHHEQWLSARGRSRALLFLQLPSTVVVVGVVDRVRSRIDVGVGSSSVVYKWKDMVCVVDEEQKICVVVKYTKKDRRYILI